MYSEEIKCHEPINFIQIRQTKFPTEVIVRWTTFLLSAASRKVIELIFYYINSYKKWLTIETQIAENTADKNMRSRLADIPAIATVV